MLEACQSLLIPLPHIAYRGSIMTQFITPLIPIPAETRWRDQLFQMPIKRSPNSPPHPHLQLAGRHPRTRPTIEHNTNAPNQTIGITAGFIFRQVAPPSALGRPARGVKWGIIRAVIPFRATTADRNPRRKAIIPKGKEYSSTQRRAQNTVLRWTRVLPDRNSSPGNG